MPESRFRERIVFHDAIETMEVDFRGLDFSDPVLVDAFFDEQAALVASTGKRWYFLVNYTECTIAPAAWDRFAERGKHVNIAHSLGTVRVGASAELREAIRKDAGREMFRANIFGSRDQALQAIGAMRKRAASNVAPDEAFLQVEGIHLRFGGVRAITGVSLQVQR